MQYKKAHWYIFINISKVYDLIKSLLQFTKAVAFKIQ